MQRAIIFLFSCFLSLSASAQPDSLQHISKLEISKKKQKIFSGRDSSISLVIDTLVMKNRSKLLFFGKKDVNLQVRHAIISNKAYILGTDGKNNGSNMDITIRFEELGDLWISAAGNDAANGSKTYPNGNGGDVTLKYLNDGIVPQQENKAQKAFLTIDTKAGGYSVNAQNDLRNIMDRIGNGARPLGQLPQGQVYSGSPGSDGKSEVKAVNEF